MKSKQKKSAQGKGTVNVSIELNVNYDIYKQLNFMSMINPLHHGQFSSNLT